jgi:hypothetical protein
MKMLGSYTIVLQTVLNESGAANYADQQLPSHKLRFTIVGKSQQQQQQITPTKNCCHAT